MNRRDCLIAAAATGSALTLQSQKRKSKLRLDGITESNVLAFLDHLESARGNSVATRNSRLTAIRSFCRYLIRKDITHAAEYGLIVSLSGKKGPKPDIPYLEPAEVKLLLEQPNQDQLIGLRDYALIQFLYNTGVRVSEALSLSVGALELGAPAQVRVNGKGQKDRVCPLWRSTTALLKRYIGRWKLGADRKSTRLNSSHLVISYAVFCLKKKKKKKK